MTDDFEKYEDNPKKLEEKIKLEANEFLLKSKSFLLFTINEHGKIERIQQSNSGYAEWLGLLTYSQKDIEQSITDEVYGEIEDSDLLDDDD